MKRILPFSILLASLGCGLSAREIQSPDGSLSVTLALDEGAPYYEVRHQGSVAIERSSLGLETSIGSFASGLRETVSETRRIDERYELPHGKMRSVHYKANELTTRFANEHGDTLEVVFRVSNDDVAFRYGLASEDKRRVTIESEATAFDLPETATAFITHQAAPGTGWMSVQPSYEEAYMLDVPVGTPSPTGLGFTYPALFRLGDKGWALISETGVTSRYCGTRLDEPSVDGRYPIAFPQPGENGGVGATTVSASLPFESPWRTITIGKTLAPIVESTVATDVVEPLYEASMDYQPGRSTWSWLLWQNPSMNEADQRAFIELADTMDYEYILIDSMWDVNLGEEKLEELVAFAQSKGVDVLLWYNSNGYWNDAPFSPHNRMDTAPVRQNEMAWLQSIGVKGLKIDFFGGDKQTTMKLYEDLLTDANRFGLSLNFHGTTLPRGWERMYPNFITAEAITASENLIFTQDFADKEALNSTIFPFVRNPVAAMDYGPVLLNKRFSREHDQGNIRRTTDAFQLATAVLYFSPIQHFGLTPNNLEEQPDFVIDFLREVPAAWDEVRYVDGYPGEYTALARRSRDRWYVAATNGSPKPRAVRLELPWLKGKTLTMIHDKTDGRAAKKEVKVDAKGIVYVDLGVGGGVVLFQ
ncbi:glycoside hydrolase family 97 catalytic domain-containing protein [Pelagicoccus sp. SDUM812003]|uniref:glycoside hydrolase family 97 protein n=1 Tax=Pelagicoccus sp. SDUM812003 TaxID=3041267 RepID=UPI00280E8620|nr:glycoside hydrolase family 97 catalytic domain-containing protein [Pelagicoccus sp. SDUM812003]MDQ8202184.1 glycoside hydrolase family 97 catalytic domain-containing protein [Pelagicoccus sp. SDUM812003]